MHQAFRYDYPSGIVLRVSDAVAVQVVTIPKAEDASSCFQ